LYEGARIPVSSKLHPQCRWLQVQFALLAEELKHE